MTRRFERRPGSEETLLALYDAVIAAEELDLEEQADLESRLREFAEVVEAEDVQTDSADDADIEDDERPSMSQAVGVVEHLLGGHPIE
jgi:hypothetical protein